VCVNSGEADAALDCPCMNMQTSRAASAQSWRGRHRLTRPSSLSAFRPRCAFNFVLMCGALKREVLVKRRDGRSYARLRIAALITAIWWPGAPTAQPKVREALKKVGPMKAARGARKSEQTKGRIIDPAFFDGEGESELRRC